MAWLGYMKNSNPDPPSLTGNTNFNSIQKACQKFISAFKSVHGGCFTYITCACDVMVTAGKHYLGRRIYVVEQLGTWDMKRPVIIFTKL